MTTSPAFCSCGMTASSRYVPITMPPCLLPPTLSSCARFSRGGDLRDVPGVGEAIAAKLTELLASGRLEYYEKLKNSFPPGLLELMRLPGISARTAGRLMRELGISSIDELEAGLRSGRTVGFAGLGEKSVETWLKEIDAHRHAA